MANVNAKMREARSEQPDVVSGGGGTNAGLPHLHRHQAPAGSWACFVLLLLSREDFGVLASELAIFASKYLVYLTGQ
jgi:hypothetical protein